MYLYVKTHNATGLKYLGKTVKDPYKYKGSGTHWLRHLAKYGNDVTTEILLETNDKDLLKEKGIYYSNLWNIVESKDWANIVPESGDGGDTSTSPNHIRAMKEKSKKLRNGTLPVSFKGKHHSEETKKIISEKNKTKLKGKKKPAGFAENLSKRMSGEANPMYGKEPWNKGKTGVQPKSLETKKKLSIPVVFRGVEYYSIREAARQNNLSDYLVKKEIYGNGFAKARSYNSNSSNDN